MVNQQQTELGDMSPRLAGNDFRDGAATDAQFTGDDFHVNPGGKLSPHMTNTLWRKLRHSIPLTYRGPVRIPSDTIQVANQHPTLSECVLDVVLLRSEEQMRWPDAEAYVAVVECRQPIRDGAVRQYPRDAVRTFRDILTTNFPDNLTVPTPGVLVFHPEPARVGLVNFRPEGMFRVFRDKMGVHREPPTLGVTPSAVDAARGHFCCR